MSHEVHKVSVRNALTPRREPYWGPPLAEGRYIGVRKRSDGTCTWVARLRDDDGKQRYRSLGQAGDRFDYHAAKRTAEEWFAGFEADVHNAPLTVAQACREYVEDLKAEGRTGTAADADGRFRRTVYDNAIGKVVVEKIKTTQLKTWRNDLPGGKSSQNRYLNTLRAALNLAVRHRRVNPAVAERWKAVKPHSNADKRRSIYLDLKQRRALLKACDGAFRDLVEAAMLTGARPGELATLRRSDFDGRTGTITFNGKTGSRSVPLSPSALALFNRVSKGKHPSAYLLTQDDGKPWKRSDWDHLMRDARAEAELPSGTVLYTLRHSWITEALRSGMSTLDVARLTGTSLAMIQKHYGHLVAESARDRLADVEML